MNKQIDHGIGPDELEDDEEGYLDPNDLEIVDDEKWNPSDEDILSYAMKLGFDIENDPDELFEIAYYYLKYPLPPGWRRAIYKDTKELMYINMKDGEIEIATEIEDMARQAYEEKKEELLKMAKGVSVGKPEVKVVPNKKIPPINQKKNDTGLQTKIVPSEIKKDEKLLNLSENNSLSNLEEESEEESPSAFFDRKKMEIDNLKKKMNEENEQISKNYNNSDISFTDNSEINIDTEGPNKITPMGLYGKNKKDDSEKKKKEIEAKKKEYFEEKLKELKNYEVKIRENYSKTKEEYKNKKEEMKERYEQEYKNKIDKELEKLNKQYKEKLNLYQTQLMNNNKKEYDKYVNELDKKMKSETNSSKQTEKELNEINSLTQKKIKIKDEIQKAKNKRNENNDSINKMKESLKRNKELIDEKNSIKKNNITKQHEMQIKNLEIEKEKEYSEYIKESKLNTSQINPTNISNTNIKDFHNELMKSNFFENYQKALDDDYEINCKSIKQDFILNQSKEMNNFTTSMQIETNEKIKQYTLKIADLENEYFSSLSQIRESSKNATVQNNNFLKEKFDSALSEYETLKNKIIKEGDEFISSFISSVHSCIVIESNVSNAEIKLEEFILNQSDTQMIRSQRAKTAYEIAESEFIYKTFAIQYVIDIVNEINSFIIENPMKQTTSTNDAITCLVAKAKSKLEQYKFKYNQDKGNKLYPFLSLIQGNEPVINGSVKNFKLVFSPSSKGKIPSERYNESQNININREQIKIEDEEHEQIDSDGENNNQNMNNNNDLNCYVIDNNVAIPLLSDYTIHMFDNDELSLYTDITVFLKNEYTKIEEINSQDEEGEKKTKLNLLILDKIKIYTEDAFNFIQLNIDNPHNRKFFKEKLQLLVSNINDYKKNFYLEPHKYNNNSMIGINEEIKNDKPNCITQKSFAYLTKSNTGEELKRNKNNNKVNMSVQPSKINGAFDNFYSQYNSSSSLNKMLTSPFANEYFNYKKNKYEIESKLNKQNFYYIK